MDPCNFLCKAFHYGECKKWLRTCVGAENCDLQNYGAPCPRCAFSSPLERAECAECKHLSWKRVNYQEEGKVVLDV